ncbi:sugar lactone lactonase YvrE [Kribbella amoyensis]|uniref:Sugar lactone lactonase YvrE n=1 Tax=Kribbella amoyensis TaxID=996641 RepID=A0A561BKC7_9ACTN|nr:SMP-30/gluconolactonase/LRE family protein [Kribbella amoyensis]TWD79305.1 sugar lactone lactonase YvrE [Kribbella amoyensis]
MRSRADRISETAYVQGESPRLDPRTGDLVWVDIAAGRVHRGRLAGGVLTVVRDYDIGRSVGVAAPLAVPGAGWVLAVREGFAHLAEDGTVTSLVTGLTSGRDLMNDGACHPDGSFWAGSQAIPREPRASLYRLDPDGAAETVLTDLTVANGLDFASDGATAYFVDTLPHRRLEAIALKGGRVPGERTTIVEVPGGNPDGLVLDDEGCVWVAVWDASEVRRYAPTGELLATVELPVPRPTAVCFQGSTLVITTASLGLEAPPAGSGHLFAVDAGVTGPSARPWRGECGGVAG